MEFLWKKFFNTAKFYFALRDRNKSLILFSAPRLEDKREKMLSRNLSQSGFMTFILLPVVVLMMTGVVGFFSLGLGIKNITRTQSQCIQVSNSGQKELAILLRKIIKLNDRVLFLHRAKIGIDSSIATALMLGQLYLVPKLKKIRESIKITQKNMMMKQESILAQASLIKKRMFRELRKKLKALNSSHIREDTFYKKALALQKKKVGDQAYIYQPEPDFINQQKIRFSWRLDPFFSWHRNLKWILPQNIKQSLVYNCITSLKQKGNQWISSLYH